MVFMLISVALLFQMNSILLRLTQRTCGRFASCSRCVSISSTASTSELRKDNARPQQRNRNRRQPRRRINPADTFGLLAGPDVEHALNVRHFKRNEQSRLLSITDEDEDIDEEANADGDRPETVGFLVRKHDAEWYGHECDKLAKEGKIAECVAMLERRMLVVDNVRPIAYNFNVVLRALAPLGHVRTAISLYEKMCALGVPISRTALTYLYNACANAKPVDGQMAIACAEEVRAATAKRGYQPERVHFCTLIKLYARHGTYEQARRVFMQMIDAGYSAEVDAYCNLLQACVNDKDTGCGPAIKIFRSLLKRGQRPTLSSFNLLLRILRDCRFADDFQLVALTDDHTTSVRAEIAQLGTRKLINDAPCDSHQEVNAKAIARPSSGAEDAVGAIDHATTPLSQLTAQQRFGVVGGIDSFMSMMNAMDVKPDIRIFSQMVDLIEDNLAGETHLLQLMEERYHLQPDVPLLNALIKRRAARGAFNDAVKCLQLMTKLRLNPDEKTFGCLALGCRTTRDGKELVRTMMVAGMKPNMPVLGAMITNAIGRFNFDLAGFVVSHIVKHRMPVGQKFITCVHAAMTSCSHTLKEKKQSLPPHFATNYRDFRLLLLETLPEIKLELTVDEGDNLQEQVEKVDDDALRNADEKPWATKTSKYL